MIHIDIDLGNTEFSLLSQLKDLDPEATHMTYNEYAQKLLEDMINIAIVMARAKGTWVEPEAF